MAVRSRLLSAHDERPSMARAIAEERALYAEERRAKRRHRLWKGVSSYEGGEACGIRLAA